MPHAAPTVQFRSTAPVVGAQLSTWSATMPTETHPIDARPSLSLIAASILIVVVGVFALATHVQGPSTDAVATEAVAEFGD